MIYDLVGVGFGPSNLAVAAALHDSQNKDFKSLFLEKKPEFSWHKDMMLDGSFIQVSFLKDIAIMRDPTSKFSFLNYLNEKNRLLKFINLRRFHPSRLEFNDYLKWAAEKLNYLAKYNSDVISIKPIFNGKNVECIETCYKDQVGSLHRVLSRNLVVSVGFKKNIPLNYPSSLNERVFHTNDFLSEISKIDKNENYKFNVIGSGQSAIECALYLYEHFKNSSVNLCTRSHALHSIDNSHFVNEIFLPENRHTWFYSDEKTRTKLLNEYRSSNYSAASGELIDKIYSITYEEQISKNKRFFVSSGLDLSSLDEKDGKIKCVFTSKFKNDIEKIDHCDYLICGTGYKTVEIKSLLQNFENLIKTGKDNKPMVSASCKILGEDCLKSKLFILGCNESTHGISESLFSNMAVRSMEVVNELLGENKCIS